MIITRIINMMMIVILIINTMIIIPELALVAIMFIANITSRRNNSPSTIHIATFNPPRYHQPSAMYLTKKHNDDDDDESDDDNDDCVGGDGDRHQDANGRDYYHADDADNVR
jgi:hypothetical protein